MAEKKTGKPAADAKSAKGQSKQEQPKKKGCLFKILLILLVLVMLIGGAIAAVIYFKIIDFGKLAEEYKLRDVPVVGQYLPKPKTNFEPVELPPENPAAAQPPAAQQPAQPAVPPGQAPKTPNNVPPGAPPPSPAEIAKAQQEEAKRISKLARLYGGMKPDEAIPILNQLDDDTVLAIFGKMEEEQVTKLMAQMDPTRAARLTNSMLKAKKPPASTPL